MKPDPRRETLRPGCIDLWLIDPGAPTTEDEGRWLALLSPDERAKYERFVVQPARWLHLVARALLRTTLARYVRVAPEDWTFGVNAHGRPHVEGPPAGRGLHFNLSHTDGLVALAVADEREVGVDVEKITRRIEIDRLAPAVFAKPEQDTLAHAAEAEKCSVFFALWTLKEAYIKARGMGLSLGLDGFAFDLHRPEPSIAFTKRCPDDAGRWRFWRLAPTPAHRLALAAPATTQELRVLWTGLAVDTEPR